MTQPLAHPEHIAVIDVGKTNAKLALVDGQTLNEIAVVTQPNTVLAGPPYPHFDLERHWQFFLEQLKAFHAEYGIDAISITTHGASIVLLDEAGDLATPMLDYEHDGPDGVAEEYNALRPPFAETGSARLPGGLNVGAQIHWLFHQDPAIKDRTAHVITYPQYWGQRLTGRWACDVTSLGCHTDLWNPWTGEASALAERLGIADKIAPAQKSSDILGPLLPEVSAATGIPQVTPVACGIHDSNASLVPHLRKQQGQFCVVSTGTWVVCLAIGGSAQNLDPERDSLVNVNAFGSPVPSARFMGGREFEIIRDGSDAVPTNADRDAVHSAGTMLLPAVVDNSGPFAGRTAEWINPPETDGARIYALSLYLALMTHTCLELAGGAGPTIIEGPFARNQDYLAMLSVLRSGGIETASSATGTSVGAAMLLPVKGRTNTAPVRKPSGASLDRLQTYASEWKRCVEV